MVDVVEFHFILVISDGQIDLLVTSLIGVMTCEGAYNNIKFSASPVMSLIHSELFSVCLRK